jgi:hypothetical protein
VEVLGCLRELSCRWRCSSVTMVMQNQGTGDRGYSHLPLVPQPPTLQASLLLGDQQPNARASRAGFAAPQASPA